MGSWLYTSKARCIQIVLSYGLWDRSAVTNIQIHFVSFALILFMTLEHKFLHGEKKIDEQWKYLCPLFNQPLHIPLWFCEKELNIHQWMIILLKIENLERDVPWCPG